MFIVPLKTIVLLLFAGMVLSSCSGRGDESDDEVLATVNGSPVTKSELDTAAERLFGKGAAPMMTDQTRKTALESLIRMRAIAQAQERSLNQEALRRIDIKARHYREELLAEAYLRDNAEPYMPAQNEIEDYYRKHPQLFGARTVYDYEILMPRTRLQPEEMAGVLDVLSAARTVKSWRAYAGNHPAIAIRQNQSDGSDLDNKLLGVIKVLAENEVSNIVHVDGKPLLIRMLSINTTPAKPLHEVQADIRRTLAVRHMKTAIAAESEKVLEAADVVYMNDVTDESN